jgi:hypothetical protein
MLHLDSQELRFPADSSKWEHWLRWSSARCKDAVSSGFSSNMRWKPIGFPFVFGNTFGTTDSGYIFVFGTSVSHQKLRNLDIGPMLSMATLGPKGRFEKGTHGSCYSILFMVNIPISWILHKCTLHCVYIYIICIFYVYYSNHGKVRNLDISGWTTSPSSDPSNNEPSWICTEPPHNPGKRKPPVKSSFSSWGEGL